jgi:hypothetical protein
MEQLTLQDYEHAGEQQAGFVRCAWCLTRVDLAPREGWPVGWQFLAEREGWMCGLCFEAYKKGYSFFLQCRGFKYHLACALKHNLVRVSELNDVMWQLQKQVDSEYVRGWSLHSGEFEVRFKIGEFPCEICDNVIQ